MPKILVALLLVVAFAACAGDQGPMGPEGPAGPPGPAGPQGPQGPGVETFSGTATLDGSGRAIIAFDLPGFNVEHTLVNCWVSEDNVVWLKVAIDTNSGTGCAVTLVPDGLRVGFIGFPVGWTALAIVGVPV